MVLIEGGGEYVLTHVLDLFVLRRNALKLLGESSRDQLVCVVWKECNWRLLAKY
jgi:hypothetical protein